MLGCHQLSEHSTASLNDATPIMSTRPLVLLTGGSGYIGAHTIDNFLRHGYRLRLAGRNANSCQKMLQTHNNFKDSIETVTVEDITVPGAFDSAVKDVDGVIHMASPFFHNMQDTEKDMLLPAIDGTVGILKSIAKNAPKVKCVVITSSIAAIADFSKGLRPGHVYDETQWNPVTYQYAKDNRPAAYA
jgi:nucleoside-diphosphate-sugar epimerase